MGAPPGEAGPGRSCAGTDGASAGMDRCQATGVLRELFVGRELSVVTLQTSEEDSARHVTRALSDNFLSVEVSGNVFGGVVESLPAEPDALSLRRSCNGKRTCRARNRRCPGFTRKSRNHPHSLSKRLHLKCYTDGARPILASSRGHPRRSIIDKRSAKSFIRINDKIRAREVRVIDDEGNQLGILQPFEALKIARERGLDLVEVSPNAVPPVCRIQDYGKYLYEKDKSDRAGAQEAEGHRGEGSEVLRHRG